MARFVSGGSSFKTLILCLALTGLATSTLNAETSKADAIALNLVVNTIDKLIANRIANSVFYKTRGQLVITDFGTPIANWRSEAAILQNEISTNLRSLIFYAVCKNSKRAMKRLFTTNRLIYGGVFTEAESEYLHFMAAQLALDLNFRKIYRNALRTSLNNPRFTMHKRRVFAALNEGQHKTARHLLPSFSRLCRRSP